MDKHGKVLYLVQQPDDMTKAWATCLDLGALCNERATTATLLVQPEIQKKLERSMSEAEVPKISILRT